MTEREVDMNANWHDEPHKAPDWHLAGFDLQEPSEPSYKCYDCGALVHDWVAHREWHHEL